MNGERQLHSACQVSCGQPLWQSPSSPHQFSLNVAALFALIVISCQKPTHPHEITWCACGLYTRAHGGSTRNLRVGPQYLHSNALQDKYSFIVAPAQIRPPHSTISCLTSRSAINLPHHSQQDEKYIEKLLQQLDSLQGGGGGGGGERQHYDSK